VRSLRGDSFSMTGENCDYFVVGKCRTFVELEFSDVRSDIANSPVCEVLR